MNELVEIGLTNALLATLLAALVWGVTLVWRNPHVGHVLWMLVLLKLVTPPMMAVPVAWPTWLGAENAVVESGRAANEVRSRTVAVDRAPADQPIALHSNNSAALPEDDPVYGQSPAGVPWITWTWQSGVLAVWIAGSLIWAVIVVARIVRFHRLLGRAAPAGASLIEMADQVATALGVRRRPDVRVAAGHIPPLVWPVGRRPTIVLPAVVVESLGASRVKDVLAHEMAHIARRDHWVRWLELAVGALYWWHPVCWFARRRLRAAEEVCCDALVVLRTSHGEARDYARTLIELVDLTSGSTVRQPALGSGMGVRHPLKRRIEMLVSQRMPSRASTLTKVVLFALAATVLPVSAVAWQADKPPEPASPPAEEAAAIGLHRGQRIVVVLPKDPYRIAAGDVLEIRAPKESLLPNGPIDGLFLVEPSGNVHLGAPYGRIRLEGMTLEEAEEAALQRLSRLVRSPQVSLTIGGWQSPRRQKLVSIPDAPYRIAPGDLLEINAPKESLLPDGPLNGLYLVEPSGKVSLGPHYGREKVAGLTLEEAEEAILRRLAQLIRSPQVAVTLGGWKLALEQSAEPRTLFSDVSWEPTSTSTGPDEELAEVLREHVARLEVHHKTAEARFRTGTVPQVELLGTAFELAIGQGELALAEGRPADAIASFKEARAQAEQGERFVEAQRDLGHPAASSAFGDGVNLTKAKIKLLQAKRAAAAQPTLRP